MAQVGGDEPVDLFDWHRMSFCPGEVSIKPYDSAILVSNCPESSMAAPEGHRQNILGLCPAVLPRARDHPVDLPTSPRAVVFQRLGPARKQSVCSDAIKVRHCHTHLRRAAASSGGSESAMGAINVAGVCF